MSSNNEFLIGAEEKMSVRGVAVREGVSRNGIMYSREELKKFAKTMKGVSIIKDHKAIVDNAVGVVEKTKVVNDGEEVHYEGWIKDNKLSEQIKDGRVKHVSIGAIVGKLVKEKEEDEFVIAKDITSVELSTVVVPGVPGATIQQALEKHKTAIDEKERQNVPPINEDLSKFIKFKISANEKTEEKYSEAVKKLGGLEMANEDKKVEEDTTVEAVTEEDFSQKVNMEVKKKMEEAKIKEMEASLLEKSNLISEREKLFEEQKTKLKEMEDRLHKISEERKQELVGKYNKLAEVKCVKSKDVSKLSEETIKLLVEQLESVPEKVVEVQEPTSRGEVGNTEDFTAYPTLAYEKSEFGSGYAIFQESYNPTKFKKLAR